MVAFNPTADAARTRSGASLSMLLWLAIAVAAAAAAYVLYERSFGVVVKSFQKPEFSHGYIIPLISAWIVWQRRRLVWSLRQPGAWSGWLVVGVAVAIALLGHVAGLTTPPYLGLLLLLIGLPAAAIGWPSTRLLVVPVAFLAFTYPIPADLYIQLSTTLQLISSRIGAGLLDLAGVPVFLDGNIIDLGVMKLQVAEACSGLRYLLPLVSFGTLCAFMYRAPWWAKLLVVLITVPLTIALNGLRIAMTGLFVHFGSQGLAEGFMHLFEGWVIFLLALAVLFALMFGILRLVGWRGGIADMLDFDRMAGTFDGRPQAAASPSAVASTIMLPRPLLLSAATMALAAILVVPLSQRAHVIPDRPGLLLFPTSLGEWTGTPSFLEPEIERTLDVDDYVLLDFRNESTGDTVNLWIAYNDVLLHRVEFHLPTRCLPGSGWEFVELSPQRTPVVDLAGEPLVVNRGLIAKGTERIVMYYWLELRGRSVHRSQQVKFINFWDSITLGRSDGALVRIYTPLAPDEAPEAGDARLEAFLERAYPHLEPHVGAGS